MFLAIYSISTVVILCVIGVHDAIADARSEGFRRAYEFQSEYQYGPEIRL